MSETSPANGAATDAQPAGQTFSLDKLYVKDVSFEAPGAPQVFASELTSQPQLQMNPGGHALDAHQTRPVPPDHPYRLTARHVAGETQPDAGACGAQEIGPRLQAVLFTNACGPAHPPRAALL